MTRVLVSILSDYVISNFLLIKEMEGQFDKLVFITTKKMIENRKGLFLEKSLNLPINTIRRIVVEEDDFPNILSKLECSKYINQGDEFIVNLTGGTKIMSIAVYEFFQKKGSSQFFYIPIGKNTIRCLNNATTIDIKYRLNLQEYFLLYGLTFEAKKELVCEPGATFNLFNKCRQKKFRIWALKEIRDAHSSKTPEHRRYYSGEWFEEYTYLRLKKDLKLSDDSIVTGAFIQRDNTIHTNDNEIDVMFVKDNALYVGECKVGLLGQSKDVKATTEGYLYKLAAISKDFGLKVNSYIFTLQNMDDPTIISSNKYAMLKDRAKILGVSGIIDCNKFNLNDKLI